MSNAKLTKNVFLLAIFAVLAMLLVQNVAAAGVFIPKFKYDMTLGAPGVYSIDLNKDDTYATKMDVTLRRALDSTSFVVYYLRREPTNDFALPVRRVFQYLTIENNDAAWYDIESAQITFEVSKTELSQRSIAPSQVVMYYYHPDDDWVAIPTTILSQQGEAVSYIADAPHLGNFAVAIPDSSTGKLAQVTQPQVVQEQPETQEQEQQAEDPSSVLDNALDVVERRSEAIDPEIYAPTTEAAPVETTDNELAQIIIISFAGFVFVLAIGLLLWQISKMSKKTKAAKKMKKQIQDNTDALKNILSRHSDGDKQPAQPSVAAKATKSNAPAKAASLPKQVKRLKKDITAQPLTAQYDGNAKHLQHQINDLQDSLQNLQKVTKMTEDLAGEQQVNAKEIVTERSTDLENKLGEVEPRIIKSFIAFEKSKGKNVQDIITALMDAGFSEDIVKRYVQ